MKHKFDKSTLNSFLVEKQKAKGTFDSPCMSICDYDKVTSICQTCLMKKEEKKKWKTATEDEKDDLGDIFMARRSESKIN